jgi:hypothetical protein
VDVPQEDYAAMLAAVETQMPRDDIATELGVDESVLDQIASGYVPDSGVADRLRALASDDASGSGSVRWSMSPRAVVIFVAVDTIVFAIILAIVFLR